MKRFLSLALSVIMVLAVLPVMASAEETVIPISECGGVIKSGATYSISTAEEFLLFEEMNDKFRGATIILTKDIAVYDGIFSVDENQKPLYNGTFVLPEPIDAIDVFKGTFDGQGYTISGLYVEGEEYVGLFEKLTGTVKNLSIENSLIIGNSIDGVGAVGSICGEISSSAKVEKYFSTAIVICRGDGLVAGGLAGSVEGEMTDCYFNGTVIAENCTAVGGVVGQALGAFKYCINAGDVYGGESYFIGGFVGISQCQVSYCANTGKVYGNWHAANFAGIIDACDNCYAAGEVYSQRPSNFMSDYSPSFELFDSCYFVGEEGDSADYSGKLDQEYARYMASVKPDPLGMPTIYLDKGIYDVDAEFVKNNGNKWNVFMKNFVVDTGNENNGYPIPKNLQRRTVAPSITNVEYEKSFDTRNTFTVTVTGRPAMIQFIEPTNGTRTYDRNHKNVTIKSYDADGNEVNSLDRTAAYEVWSIYSNMMPNVEIRTRAKYLSDARYTWESETYDFPMILANPIVSMELSSTSGKKGPVPATVVADDKTEKVMFKMPDNSTVTVASKATDENGNKIFSGKAWMNKDGLNEIRIFIYRNSVWKQAGTLEYTAE